MYNEKQINELIDYLGECVKESYLSEESALELILTKNWKEIDKMREMGDAYANDPEYQDRSDLFRY